MSDEPRVRFLISLDRGETWKPMPENWKQEGRIVSTSPDIVVQSVGRGRDVWYAVDVTPPPAAENDRTP